MLVCVITVAGAAWCATLRQQGTLLAHLHVYLYLMVVCVCVCMCLCVRLDLRTGLRPLLRLWLPMTIGQTSPIRCTNQLGFGSGEHSMFPHKVCIYSSVQSRLVVFCMHQCMWTSLLVVASCWLQLFPPPSPKKESKRGERAGDGKGDREKE